MRLHKRHRAGDHRRIQEYNPSRLREADLDALVNPAPYIHGGDIAVSQSLDADAAAVKPLALDAAAGPRLGMASSVFITALLFITFISAHS